MHGSPMELIKVVELIKVGRVFPLFLAPLACPLYVRRQEVLWKLTLKGCALL